MDCTHDEMSVRRTAQDERKRVALARATKREAGRICREFRWGSLVCLGGPERTEASSGVPDGPELETDGNKNELSNWLSLPVRGDRKSSGHNSERENVMADRSRNRFQRPRRRQELKRKS